MRMVVRTQLLALLIVVCYASARHFVYQTWSAEGLEGWLQRDLVMTLPRLAGIAVCLWFFRKNGGFRSWGWSAALGWRGGAILALTTFAEAVYRFVYGGGSELSVPAIAVGWLSTGPVAVFEETLFRALVFLPLREALSARWAAALASAFFMVYHIEAQPIALWAHIFVFGLGTCAAIHRGVGLPWIIAGHWFVDGLSFHLVNGPGLEWARAVYPLLFLGNGALALLLLGGRANEAKSIA